MSPSEQSLDNAVAQLMRDAAADAERYLDGYLLPKWREVIGGEGDNWESLLFTFAPGLRLVLRHYALGHRRFARLGASAAAEHAIAWAERQGAELFLNAGESEPFWKRFINALTPRGKKSSEQLRWLVTGIVDWNFEAYRVRGEESLVAWILTEVRDTGRVEHVHQLLREIPGFGPKAASRLLRDLTLVFQLEERVHPADRYLLQTVGRPVRKVAGMILTEAEGRRLPDWVLAGKLSRACRLAGVSGARFNAGAEWRYGIAAGDTDED